MPADCYDVIITGAGPAGLFCASSLPRGKKILILEKMSSPGKKLLLAGSGRCNITHSGDAENFLAHYRAGAKFFKRAFYSFTNTNLIEFFESRGISFVEEDNGKIFPASGCGSDILDELIKMCGENGAEIRTGSAVESARKEGSLFVVVSQGVTFYSHSLVIASGGRSYPATGSSGDASKLAAALGLPVNENRPALTPVYPASYQFADLSGIAVRDSAVSVHRGGKCIARMNGDILFTHKNLSGPGILDISGHVRAGDSLKCSLVSADSIPLIKNSLSARSSDTVKKILISAGIPSRLALRILEVSGIDGSLRMGNLSRTSSSLLAENICAYNFSVEKTGSWGEAMVTAGGVSLESVASATMESRAVPGLYVIGEALDIDGATGGYNLQMCFSTARAAAKAISEK